MLVIIVWELMQYAYNFPCLIDEISICVDFTILINLELKNSV